MELIGIVIVATIIVLIVGFFAMFALASIGVPLETQAGREKRLQAQAQLLQQRAAAEAEMQQRAGL